MNSRENPTLLLVTTREPTLPLPPLKSAKIVKLPDAQMAAYAADGFARSTGKSALLLTFGVEEALLAASGLLTAWGDKTPLLWITYLSRREEQKIGESLTAITKKRFQYLSGHLEELQEKIQESLPLGGPLRITVSDKRGWAELSSKLEPLVRPTLRRPHLPSPSMASIRESLSFLQKSRSPLLLIGSGGVPSLPPQSVALLAKQLGAPVCLTASATCMPSPLLSQWKEALAEVPLLPSGNLIWTLALRRADRMVALGAALSEVDGFGLKDFSLTRAKILSVGLKKSPLADLQVTADAAQFVEEITARFSTLRRQAKKLSKLKQALKVWQKALRALAQRAEGLPYVTPELASYAIVNSAPRETLFVSEGGACGMWLLAQSFLNPLLFPVQNGTIGVTLPMALGAAAERSKRPIFCILGDGAFYYQCHILQDLAEQKLPVAVFCFNDACWGAIRLGQNFAFRARTIGTDLPQEDYAALAQAYHCPAETVKTPKELKRVVERASQLKNAPLFVDVKLLKDSVPPSGFNFVLAEFDGALRALSFDFLTSGVVSGLKGRLPLPLLLELSKVLRA